MREGYEGLDCFHSTWSLWLQNWMLPFAMQHEDASTPNIFHLEKKKDYICSHFLVLAIQAKVDIHTCTSPHTLGNSIEINKSLI